MKFEVYNQNLYARFVPLIVAGTSEYLTVTITNGILTPVEVV
jgi:hypothetical protein